MALTLLGGTDRTTSRGTGRRLIADPYLFFPFFPISQSGPASAQMARAKAICARCMVQDDCLRYALAADPVHGVWGGMSEEERRRLRRRGQKARARAAERSSLPAARAGSRM